MVLSASDCSARPEGLEGSLSGVENLNPECCEVVGEPVEASVRSVFAGVSLSSPTSTSPIQVRS